MTKKQNGTVIGVFQNHDSARQAIRALRDAGFEESQIGVASSHQEGLRTAKGDDAGDETYAAEGAMTGVATGAGIGALWGLGILAGVLPAIGPAIAGGTLAIILSSAAAGAAAAGLTGALVGLGFSKEEAEFYESELKAGRTVVTIHAGDRRNEVVALLRRHGAYDMSNRPADDMTSSPEMAQAHRGSSSVLAHESDDTNLDLSRGAGHTSQASQSQSGAADRAGRSQASGGGQKVQAYEEKLNVQKAQVETGDVTVRKEVHTEHKTLDIPVTREEVVIERRAGSGQTVSANDLEAGQEIRIPVREEQVKISKETVVAEEVNVGKRKVQDTKHVDEKLRKEEIKVETQGDVNVRDQRNKQK